MNEKEFTEIIQEFLQKSLENHDILISENLVYNVVIDEHGNYNPKNPKKPTRGNFAFQTDLLIKQNDIPLVVIEIKLGRFTTHDVITYSSKALKHKEVYPYLRYGLVIGASSNIQNRFFTHNVGFDFSLALKNTEVEELMQLIEVVNDQLQNAKSLLNIFSRKTKVKSYSTKLIFR